MSVRADSHSYTPPRPVARLESDLAEAAWILIASHSDIIVAPTPDDALLDLWFPDGRRPSFLSVRDAAPLASADNFRPWGLCRSVFNLFGLHDQARSWHWRDLLSRKSSVALERLLPSDASAALCSSVSDYDALAKSPRRGLVLKSLWSASGRGVRFYSPDQLDAARKYAESCIAADGAVVVERLLDRVAEFSFIGVYDGSLAEINGINVYHSSPTGAFGQEFTGVGAADTIERHTGSDWQKYYSQVRLGIEQVLSGSGYHGPFGIDAMLYRDDLGRHHLRLCTELNIRYTMGHIGHALSPRLSPSTSASWGMQYFKNDNDWLSFAREQSALHPLVLDSDGLILSGFFRLSSLTPDKRFAICGLATTSQ